MKKERVNIQAEYSTHEQKCLIIKAIKKELALELEKQNSDRAEVTTLVEFTSKGMFARKRVKGRNFSYEFGRLPKNIQERLDKEIAKILEYEMK